MSQFLTSDYLIAFLFSVIRMSTPIIFCALGALIASHAGGEQRDSHGVGGLCALGGAVWSTLNSFCV